MSTDSKSSSRLPTVLLTGFLGAGKTTFLNCMLDHLRTRPERVCLIINEFGKIGIDSSLVSAGPETIHEVNAGSIFCVCTRDQFLAALDRAATAEPPFDLLVIESTGIAATSDLGGYIYGPPINGRIAVLQNFCLVDAANFHKVRATLPAVSDQVAEAGTLIINKADLVSSEQLAEVKASLRELNALAPIHVVEHGNANMAELLGDYQPQSEWRSQRELATCQPTEVYSFSMENEGIMDPDRFSAFIASLPDDLLRGKGTVHLPGGVRYVEWVLSGWAERPFTGPGHGKNRLVLIGSKFDEEKLQKDFDACLA